MRATSGRRDTDSGSERSHHALPCMPAHSSVLPGGSRSLRPRREEGLGHSCPLQFHPCPGPAFFGCMFWPSCWAQGPTSSQDSEV